MERLLFMPGPKWFCVATYDTSNAKIIKITKTLESAQQALGNGKREAIIPMKGSQAGDPNTLAKTWAKGLSWKDEIIKANIMRKKCVDVGATLTDIL